MTAVIEEIRIENLGVISRAHVGLGPGLTVLTGETGAGKTMVLTGLNLLLGGKADVAAVRTGQRSASVEGRLVLPAGSSPVAERAADAGADLDDDGSLVVLRTVAAEGRSRAFLGGPRRPAGRARRARRRPGDRARPVRPGPAALARAAAAGPRRVRGRRARRRARRLPRARGPSWARLDEEIADLTGRAQDRAREAELLRLGLAEVERVDPQPGEDRELADGDRAARQRRGPARRRDRRARRALRRRRRARAVRGRGGRRRPPAARVRPGTTTRRSPSSRTRVGGGRLPARRRLDRAVRATSRTCRPTRTGSRRSRSAARS